MSVTPTPQTSIYANQERKRKHNGIRINCSRRKADNGEYRAAKNGDMATDEECVFVCVCVCRLTCLCSPLFSLSLSLSLSLSPFLIVVCTHTHTHTTIYD